MSPDPLSAQNLVLASYFSYLLVSVVVNDITQETKENLLGKQMTRLDGISK
jgi:hypothetical protein